MTKLQSNTPTTAGDTVILEFGSDANDGNGCGGDMKIYSIEIGQLVFIQTSSEIDSHTGNYVVKSNYGVRNVECLVDDRW